MAKKWEEIPEKTFKEGAEFVKKIREGKFVRDFLPNQSEDYPIEKAYESVVAFMDSKEMKEFERRHSK
jgi:hypothetical protein